jgi:hypothetical protein
LLGEVSPRSNRSAALQDIVSVRRKQEVYVILHQQIPLPAPPPQDCKLSHDLNNSLGIIVGRAELLADLLSNNPEAMKHLSVIMGVGRGMANDIRTRRFRANL